MDHEESREIEENTETVVEEGVFSIHQSNVLYTLYLFGFLFCIVLDFSGQVYRDPVFKHYQTIVQLLTGILALFKTISFCCILLSIVNAMLWFDFINQVRRVENTSSLGRFKQNQAIHAFTDLLI